MDDLNIEKKIVIPEAIKVKDEIVVAYFNANQRISEYLQALRDGQHAKAKILFSDFIKYVIQLYMNLGMDAERIAKKTKTKEDDILIENIKDYIFESGTNIEKNIDWIKIYRFLQKVTYELGITKISINTGSSKDAWKEGLYDM